MPKMTGEQRAIEAVIERKVAPLRRNISKLIDDVSRLKMPDKGQAVLSKSSALLNALRGLVEAVEEITYEDRGNIRIGRHGDSIVTDEVELALGEAKKAIAVGT